MKQRLFLFLGALAIIISAGCKKKIEKQLFQPFYGVWANKNTQLIRTEQFSILFTKQNDAITAILKKVDIAKNTVKYNTKGVFHFSTANKKLIAKAQSLIDSTVVVINENSDDLYKLQTKNCDINRIIQNEELVKIQTLNKNRIEEELDVQNNILRIRLANGDIESLRMIEKISVIAKNALRISEPASYGCSYCLTHWQLGTKVYKVGNRDEINITTPQNSYVIGYGMYGNKPVIHARAAKIKTSERGMLLKQNTRLMYNPIEYTAWMENNIVNVLNKQLAIKETTSQNNSNIAANGVFWEVISCNPASIQLRTAFGKTMQLKRPDTESELFYEHFLFQGNKANDAISYNK